MDEVFLWLDKPKRNFAFENLRKVLSQEEYDEFVSLTPQQRATRDTFSFFMKHIEDYYLFDPHTHPQHHIYTVDNRRIIQFDHILKMEQLDNELLKSIIGEYLPHTNQTSGSFQKNYHKMFDASSFATVNGLYKYDFADLGYPMETGQDNNHKISNSNYSVHEMSTFDCPEKSQTYKVSAIVSTYNSEAFLRGCLEDLVRQTLYSKGKLEIIVIDSGSQENEQKIVSEFQSRHEHIVYERTQRETLYAAWNRGIKRARGIYITNANTDDRHRVDALEKLAGTLDNHPELGLAYGDCLITDTPHETFELNSAETCYIFPECSVRQSLTRQFFGPQPMWRKAVHDTVGFFNPEYMVQGDYDFFIRVVVQHGGLHIPEFLGLYCRRSDSVERSNRVRNHQEENEVHSRYRSSIPLDKIYPLLTCFFYDPIAFAAACSDFAQICLRKKSGTPRAVEILQQAYRRCPKLPYLANNLAVAQARCGNLSEAVSLLEKTPETCKPARTNLSIIQSFNKSGTLTYTPISHPVINTLPEIKTDSLEVSIKNGKQLQQTCKTNKDIIKAYSLPNTNKRLNNDQEISFQNLTSSRDDTIALFYKRVIDIQWAYKAPLFKNEISSISIKSISGQPDISVIIVAWRMSDELICNLHQLISQAESNPEIILVNNGSHDAKFAEAGSLANAYVRLKRNIGPNIGRNIGAAIAKAPVLLFLDDDALPDENLLQNFLKTFSAYDIVSARGLILGKTDNPFNHLAKHYNLGDKPFPIYADIEGNTAYRSDVFYSVGGWDEQQFGGEGVDLSRRILFFEPDQRKQIYTPDAVIYHDYATNKDSLSHKEQRHQKARQRLRHKFPDYDAFLKSWQPLKGRFDMLIHKNENKICPLEPAISICIPTYNRSGYLTEALKSILPQTTDTCEIVIVDDGSTDNTLEVVKPFLSPRVRYVQKEHSGAPQTRNRAIAEARGEYILWMDSDDILLPGTVQSHLNAIRRYPDADVLYGDVRIFGNLNGFHKNELVYDDYYKNNAHLLYRLLSGNRIPNPGTAVRKTLLEQHGGYDTRFTRAHDYHFWSRIAPQAVFKHIGTATAKWRWHDTNMSSGSVACDKKFEAEITRQLLQRHSLPELFAHLDWRQPAQAETTAYLELAGIFCKWQDAPEALKYFTRCFKRLDPAWEPPSGGDEAVWQEVERCIRQIVPPDSTAGRRLMKQAASMRAICSRQLSSAAATHSTGRTAHAADTAQKLQALSARLKSDPGNKELAQAILEEATRRLPALPGDRCPRKVSVIIPYYKQPETVEQTLVSVCRQTYSNVEIVFINDGDDERVLDTVKNVSGKFPDAEIHYHAKPHTGLADSRNFGIRKAAGDYILPLDSDDLLASTFLEKTVPVLDNDPSRGFVYSEVLFFGAKNQIWAYKDFDAQLLLQQNLMTCTTLFRKDMWKAVGGYNTNMTHGYEDWDFWISAVEKGYQGSNIHLPLFCYRRKPDSMLESRCSWDAAAKEQIISNHPTLYYPVTPETRMTLQQSTGKIPVHFIRSPSCEKQDTRRLSKARPAHHGRSPLRVLFVCHDFPPYRYAGAQLYAQKLAHAVNACGSAKVDIFYPVFREDYRDKYSIRTKTVDGLTLFELPKELSLEPQKIFNQNVADAFADFLHHHTYDCIHFHGLGQLSLAPLFVTRRTGIKTAFTFHDYWFLCDRWHMIRKDQSICTGPESIDKCTECFIHDNNLEDTPETRRTVRQYKEYRGQSMHEMFGCIDVALCPSKYLQAVFRQYGFNGIAVNQLGFDYTAMPLERTRTRKNIVFGYAGQIIARKGLNFAIDAFRQIRCQNLRLYIWGTMARNADYKNRIERAIQSDERIVYRGEYKPEQLPEIFQHIDVALVPSLMENYPLIVQEAFIHRTPVIAANVGGIQEAVSHAVNGLLVEPGSVPEFKKAMEQIITQPCRIEKFAAAIPSVKTISEDGRFHAETYTGLSNKVLPDTTGPGGNGKAQASYTVQFYVYKNVHWPMFEELYAYLQNRPEVREIIICLPDLPQLIGAQHHEFAERLLSLGATCVARPRTDVDVTFIADTIAGKVQGCGKIVNIGHGTISKGYYFTESVWTERENWVDLLCVPGPYAHKKFSPILTTRIAATGMPKLDPVFSGRYSRSRLCAKLNLNPEKKIILYAPTFNIDLSSVYDFQERIRELDAPDCCLLIKLHGSTLPQTVAQYRKLAAGISRFHFIDDPNIAPCIGGADIMISDVSSAAMEFMALNKPVILYNNPNRTNYHGYNPADIEWAWRDLGTQANSFDEAKSKLHDLIAAGDDGKAEVRNRYAAELFADRSGSACANVWRETKKLFDCPTTKIPLFSVVVTLAPDNLFAVRSVVHSLQFYSIMPLELVLIVRGTDSAVSDYRATLQSFNQFSKITTLEIPVSVPEDNARFQAVQAATGDYVLCIDDSVHLYKNFDYILYKTFRNNPAVESVTGISNGPFPGTSCRKHLPPPENISAEQYAYLCINRFQARSTAAVSLPDVPPLTAFKKSVFSSGQPDNADAFRTFILKHTRLCLSLFYTVVPAEDMQALKQYWRGTAHIEPEKRIEITKGILQHYHYPDIAERLIRDCISAGSSRTGLASEVIRSLHMRFYDTAYKKRIIKMFSEMPDLVQTLESDLKLIDGFSDAGHSINRHPVGLHRNAPDRKPDALRIVFYFFKNVHIPILLPIYKKLKELHPEAQIAFGYLPHAPQIRAGFTPDELKLLKSFGVEMYTEPQKFAPDLTFIADSVYPWVTGCGKLVHVGHGVLSKGQYYTDTAIARREEQADLVCVPGTYHADIMRKIITKPVAATGMAKLDRLFSGTITAGQVKQQYGLPQKEYRYILYAPTFNDELSCNPFIGSRINEVLPDDGTLLVIKLHGSTKKDYRQMYRRLVEQDRRVIYADELDITPFLALADVMISDVSSAVMEFAALDKPVILYNNPNRKSYQNYNPDDIEFKWRDIGIQVHNLREMQDAVKRCFDIPSEYAAKRTRYTDQLFANKHDGLAAGRIIKQSMSLLQTICFSRKVA